MEDALQVIGGRCYPCTGEELCCGEGGNIQGEIVLGCADLLLTLCKIVA
jgi:hypothetical protein